MNANKIPGILFLSLAITACGKQTGESVSNSNLRNIQSSESILLFDTYKDIRLALQINDLLLLQEALFRNRGFDLNQLMTDGETILTYAIKEDLIDIRNFLLEKSTIDLDRLNVNRQSPLMVAAKYNRINSVKVLLDNRVRLDETDHNGNTALHLAIMQDNEEIALLLIKQRASLLLTDNNFKNAFTLAQEHAPEILDIIRSVIQVETGSPDVATLRKVLSISDVLSLKSLLTRYPEIVHDFVSINPLVLAMESSDFNAAYQIVKLLLQYKTDVNGLKNGAVSPLIKAVTLQSEGFVKLLLSEKAAPDLLDNENKSALIHSVELNHLEITSELLNYGAKEKYAYIFNGRKRVYSACSVARKLRRNLTHAPELEKNKAIQERLRCGINNIIAGP